MWPIAWFLVLHTDPTSVRAHASLSNAALHERANQLASAFHELARAKELLKSSPDHELRQHVEARTTQLAPRVAYRFLDARLLGSDIVIEQDGVPVPPFEWGHAEPIDSGPHVWTARLGDYEFWRLEAVARDGTSISVIPELPFMPPSDEEHP